MTATPVQIAAVVAAYWTVSIMLVFSNKVVMTLDGMSIPAPLFITFYQCILTSLICNVAGKLRKFYVNDDSAFGKFMQQFPEQDYKLETAVKVMPLSVIFVGMITFNNLCLKYVEVSFYNVARSLTIVFNVIISYYLLGQTTSAKTMFALGVVISGFIIGIDGELNFSFVGTSFGVCSSLLVCLNGIYTKKIFPLVDNNKWKLAYVNNCNACIMFFPLLFMVQEDHIIVEHWEQLLNIQFWLIMTLTGILGFLIGIVTVMQVTMTSPLTHNISGTAKAAAQSFLAVYLWNTPMTYKGAYGIIGTLSGSLIYTYIKMNETQKTAPPAIATKDVDLEKIKIDETDAHDNDDNDENESEGSPEAPRKQGLDMRK